MKKIYFLSLLTIAITSLVHAGDEYVITIESESNLADYSEKTSLISDFLEAKEFLLSTENMISQPEKTKNFLRVLDDLSGQDFFPATEFLGITLLKMIDSDSFIMCFPFVDQKSLIEKTNQVCDILMEKNKKFNILKASLCLRAGEKNNILNIKKAIDLLEDSLKAGNHEAGMILYEKFSQNKGFEDKKRWLESASVVDEKYKYYLASHVVLEYHQKKRLHDREYQNALLSLKQGVREFNPTAVSEFYRCHSHLQQNYRLEKIVEILLELPSLSQKIPLTLECLGRVYSNAKDSKRSLFYYELAYESGNHLAGTYLLNYYQECILNEKNKINKTKSSKQKKNIQRNIKELDEKKQKIYNKGISSNSVFVINLYVNEILDNIKNGTLSYSPNELNKLIDLLITGAKKSPETIGFLHNEGYGLLVNLYAYAAIELRKDFVEEKGLTQKRNVDAFWLNIKDFFYENQSNELLSVKNYLDLMAKISDKIIYYYTEYLFFLEWEKNKDEKYEYIIKEIPGIQHKVPKNLDGDIKDSEKTVSFSTLQTLSQQDIIFSYPKADRRKHLDTYADFLSSNIVEVTERLLYNILPTRYTQSNINRESWIELSNILQSFIPIPKVKLTAENRKCFDDFLSDYIPLYKKIIDKSPIVALLVLQSSSEDLSHFFSNLNVNNEKPLDEMEKINGRRLTIALLAKNTKIKELLSNRDNILKSFEEKIDFIKPFSKEADKTLPVKQEHKKQSKDNALSQNIEEESECLEDQSNLMRCVTPNTYSFDELSDYVGRSSLTKEMQEQAKLVLAREKRKKDAKNSKIKSNPLTEERLIHSVNNNIIIEEEKVEQKIVSLGTQKYELFASIIDESYKGDMDSVKNLIINTFKGRCSEGDGARISFSIPTLNSEECVHYSMHTPHKNQDKSLKPDHIKDLKENLFEKAGYNLETVKYKGDLNRVAQ